MNKLNGTELGGAGLEISLAKPPSDKKKKEEMLRKREQRMMQAMAERSVGGVGGASGSKLQIFYFKCNFDVQYVSTELFRKMIFCTVNQVY